MGKTVGFYEAIDCPDDVLVARDILEGVRPVLLNPGFQVSYLLRMVSERRTMVRSPQLQPAGSRRFSYLLMKHYWN